MLRKRFKKLILLAVVAVAFGAGAAQGQGKSPEAKDAAGTVMESARAAIWAATADYVYQDDRDLVKIQPQLLKTIRSTSVAAFNHSLDEAVVLENKQLVGQKHLLKFQELVKTIQAQPLDFNTPAALVKAIVGKLDDNKERMADPARMQQLTLLTQRLNQLAAGTAPTAPVAATAAIVPQSADNPMGQVATASNVPVDNVPVTSVVASTVPVAPPTNRLVWLAMGMSVLGLVVALLALVKANKTTETVVRDVVGSSNRNSGSTRQSERDEILARLSAIERQISDARKAAKSQVSAQPVALVEQSEMPAVPFASLPVPASGPRLRTQYANEAPFNNSFPARALSDQPGTYSMFAIVSSEQQPDQGTFAVTGNLASHVRDHRSVLEPVCEYVGGYPLGSEASVITVEPGLVRRRGDDWEVVQRAKVRFE